jgi:hypothetical protein
MDDVTKRFFEVLDKVGISGASLCKEIPDLTKQKLSNARNGRNSIQIDVVSYVCSHYNNINSGYILTGRGSMFFEESLQVESSKVNIISDKEQDDIKKDLEIAVTQLEEDRDTIKVLKKIIKRQLSEIEELKKALKMQSPA